MPLKFGFVPSTVRIVNGHANYIEIVYAGFMVDQFVRTTKVEKQLVRVLIGQVTGRMNVDTGKVLDECFADTGYLQ